MFTVNAERNEDVTGLGCENYFKYCKNACENCSTINKIYEKLQQYETLEEQKKLFKLPCVVGDSAYIVRREKVLKLRVSKIEIFLLEGKETDDECKEAAIEAWNMRCCD